MDVITDTIALVDSIPPTTFVRGAKTAEQLRETLSKLFAFQGQQKTSIRRKLKKGRPATLRLQGLDGEQIWSLMQLWDLPLINWAEGMVDTLAEAEYAFHLTTAEGEDDEEADGQEYENNTEDDAEDDEFGEGFPDELEDTGDLEEDDEELEEDDGDDQITQKKSLSDNVDPLLDDEHFRVAEMDEFAEKMEEQLQREWDKEKEDEEGDEGEDDEDDMDSYDSAEEEDESAFVKKALYGGADEDEGEDGDDDEDDINVRYDEFFDAAAPAGDARGRSTKLPTKATKTSKRDIARAELAKKIAELESEAISEKPWDLKGEAKATSRPKDSLLEKEDLDIDFLKRSTPALTPEIAAEIEDVILKRFMDGKFNDCEVTIDRQREALPFTAVLSKEKSKEGLAETYAKDYAEKVLDHTPQNKVELEKDRAEIREMFESLCQKLDALSSLSYTPKPPPAVKDSNRPPDVAAVHMEDVVPTTETGNVSQTAPEEVEQKAKGLGKSRVEMEPEERRAARRRAKEANKKRRAADGVIIIPKKKTKVNQVDENAATGEGSETKWTSSAQVFRRMEKSKADASSS